MVDTTRTVGLVIVLTYVVYLHVSAFVDISKFTSNRFKPFVEFVQKNFGLLILVFMVLSTLFLVVPKRDERQQAQPADNNRNQET